MSTSGEVALYKNLAQNANNPEAAKARYLRSGVYMIMIMMSGSPGCSDHRYKKDKSCFKAGDKMRQYGVDGNINACLCEFLTNRKMRIVFDGKESEAVPVDSGVPQGTVLGPLLFLCHINDLPDSVKSTVRLFSDDCLLYRQIKSREDHISLQYDLQSQET